MIIDGLIDDFLAKVDLEGELCNLKHSEGDPIEDHPAVDYLCQPFGDMESGAIYDVIRIPICEECIKALHSDEWILFYCVECNSSQWLYKPWARKKYPPGTQILWLSKCPVCTIVEEKEE